MNAYEVLKERGFIEQLTHEEEIKALFEKGGVTFYIGIDPTADSLHVGHFLTVMAILTVLPMANLASPLLASLKYRTSERAFYEKARAYEGKCTMLYDLIVTTKEQILPLDAVAVHPNGVFAFCSNEKTDLSKAEKAVNALFQANKLDPNVKLIRDPHAFFRRLDSLKPASEYEDDGVVAYAAALMKNLSM